MLLLQVTAFVIHLILILSEGDPHVRLSPSNDLKPSLDLQAVLDVETSDRPCVVVVDISTVGGKQLRRSLLEIDSSSDLEDSQLIVDAGMSSYSLWQAYRNRWTLQLCAVLLMGEESSKAVDLTMTSHVHDIDVDGAFNGGGEDDIDDHVLRNDWYLTVNHEDLLDMSLSYNCWTIGRVSRKDLFCWSWLAFLRNKVETTCCSDNGILHLLDFPIAVSGGNSGLRRQPSTWQPHFDYWNEFPPFEPRLSLSVWLFATHHCASSLCSVLLRPRDKFYQSPSLFLQPNGILVTQFVFASDETKAYSSPWTVPLYEWVYITLSAHGSKVQVCMQSGSLSSGKCYDISFLEPFYYDSTIPWVVGGASSLQSFRGYVAQVTVYQGIYLNKGNFPKPDRVVDWMKVAELQQNCSRFTQSIKLLQQFGTATGRNSCSVGEWLESVFKCHVLNKRQSDSWSVEAAHSALVFIQSKLRLNLHGVYSLVHAENIPGNLLSKFYRSTVSWLKGKAVRVDPYLYAMYAGCHNRPNAMFYAGVMHFVGQPANEKKQEGMMLLLAAASQGSVLAQLALGYRHRFGIDGVPENCPMALSYYLAVAKDSLESLRGENETKTMTEAIRLSEPEMLEGQEGERTDVVQFLTYEAGYGNPDAQADLGQMHYWGQQGLQRDFNVAFHYYEQAARAGLPVAQYSLAIMYLKGHGTQQDNQTALRHLTSAAEQGVTAALNGLGYYYLNVVDPPNVTAAVNYFKRAAARGDHDAAFNLGVLYYNGQAGGAPNNTKAVKYWRIAARYGNAGASYHLALLSETCSEALEYGVAVAEKHSDIGRVLRKGVASYLNNSMLEAIFHYIQAAEAGVELAAFNVAWLSETCQDLQPTVASHLSLRYYNQSALLNYTPAIVRVGDSYWFGEWTEKNKDLAMSSYSRAAHLNNGQGLFNLAYVVQMGQLPVKREWIDFEGLSIGTRTQGNLTLALQLYDLCWACNSHGQLACSLAGVYVQMLMLIDGLLFLEWVITTMLWRNLYFFSALSGCIVGLIVWLKRTRGFQPAGNSL